MSRLCVYMHSRNVHFCWLRAISHDRLRCISNGIFCYVTVGAEFEALALSSNNYNCCFVWEKIEMELLECIYLFIFIGITGRLEKMWIVSKYRHRKAVLRGYVYYALFLAAYKVAFLPLFFNITCNESGRQASKIIPHTQQTNSKVPWNCFGTILNIA